MSAIVDARKAALALSDKFGGDVVEVTLRCGEVHVHLAAGVALDGDIETVADVITRDLRWGSVETLKNRDNPLPPPTGFFCQSVDEYEERLRDATETFVVWAAALQAHEKDKSVRSGTALSDTEKRLRDLALAFPFLDPPV